MDEAIKSHFEHLSKSLAKSAFTDKRGTALILAAITYGLYKHFQPSPPLHLLVQSIERQLDVGTRPEPEEQEGVISVHSFGPRYVSTLRDLLEIVQNKKRLSPHAPVYWKILAFSGRFQYFVDPEYLLQLGQSPEGIRHDDAFSSSYTALRSLWEHPEMLNWRGNNASHVLSIHGTPDSMTGLHLFGAQVVTHLSNTVPSVVYMRAGLREPPVDPYGGQTLILDGPQMLRHTAIYLLRLYWATFEYPVPGLEGDVWKLLDCFSTAETEADWFRVLGILIPWFKVLEIVIDVGPLFDGEARICQWPGQFQRLVDSAGVHGGCFKVLLISPHSMEDPTGKSSVISTKDMLLLPRDLVTPEPSNAADSPPAYSVSSSSSIRDSMTTRSLAESSPMPKSRHDFEIAIFSAVPRESGIVEAFFDRLWDHEEYGKWPGDDNSYILGQIAGLNIVFVQLPRTGKVAAAIAAANCSASFNRIRLSLVVGTCGGVPSDGDDRVLGDVIISQGLVQYDFGRQYLEGFDRKSSTLDNLARPNYEIRSLLAKLQMRRLQRELEDDIEGYLEAMQQHAVLRRIRHPGPQADVLFEPSYMHRHREERLCEDWEQTCGTGRNACELARQSSCESVGCETEQAVSRDGAHSESQGRPSVHFGLIGSGDTIMKSAEERDRIARDEDIIAFETEGAGIWDVFPCVVIKGIANYADTHNADVWDDFAALSSMACATAFLRQWSENCGYQ